MDINENEFVEFENEETDRDDLVEEFKRKNMPKFLADIEAGENHYNSVINPKIEERYDIFEASEEYYQKLMPKLSRRSKLVSSDVAETIEWVLPSLMDVFFASDDIIIVSGKTEEDDSRAEVMQNLINYQITALNDGFMIFYQWFKNAMISGLGILKARWEKEIKNEQVTDVVGYSALQALYSDAEIEVIDVQQTGQFIPSSTNYEPVFKVDYIKPVTEKNHPVLEVVPPTEFLFDPDAKNLDEAQFVIHKKVVNADFMRRGADAGEFDERSVEDAIEAYNGADADFKTDTNRILNKDSDLQSYDDVDDARKTFILYECYTKIDINEDGRLEDVIVTIVGDEILKVEENTFEKPPFFLLSPILEPYSIWGKSFADLIGQLQNLKTFLYKQMAVSVTLANETKMLVKDDALVFEDVLNDKPFIRVRNLGNNSIGNVVQPMPHDNVYPGLLNIFEFIDKEKEARTGVTRYNQGLDQKSLKANQTWRGVQTIMNAANQRLKLVTKIFAETGIKDLFRFLVQANQKFIDQSQVIRLTNKELEIRPDDLDGNFDLQVSAAVGTVDKQERIQNLNNMIQLITKVLQPAGIANQRELYNTVKKLYEELGFKNVDEFLISPERLQQMQQQKMTQAQMMQNQQGGMPNVPNRPGNARGIQRAAGQAARQPVQPNAQRPQNRGAVRNPQGSVQRNGGTPFPGVVKR